ncbi:MAG: glycosyltransferase family 4 protein [Hymenobacter sp.]|nr:glycosyltransferase family 4 protein [Hymenobacter sp.]
MFIGIVAPIATHDLVPGLGRQGGPYPRGRAGAPLISNLIKEYLRRGHRVLALTLDEQLPDDQPPFVYAAGRLTYVVVPCRQRTFRPNGKRLGRTADFYRFERRQLLAVLRQYQPEVVHAHWTYEFALAALAYSPDTLITVHDNARIVFNYVRTLNRFFLLLMARYVFRKGRWFTAVSPYMAGTVQPWTAAPVAVVPNPVVVPEPNRRPRPPRSRPVISLVVNGWDDRKNSKAALLAFGQIRERHPGAVLWAMGTAFVPDDAAAAFCEQHAITNVVFFGPTPHGEVLERIAASTLVLHTSLEESFGMVLAEAMSYGIPVVAGQHSGAVAWVVQDGGLLVDVTSIDAIVAATDRLLSDPALYHSLSANAVRVVRERFLLEKVADQYLALYQQCGAWQRVAPDF